MTEVHDAAQSGGPYLAVACLCENVVQRADGVPTLVNIIDRVNITVQSPDAPDTLPATNYRINLVLILKAGRARGRYDLRVVPELPDGTSRPPAVISLNFEGGDDRGVQIVSPMQMTLTHEGLYWLNIYLAGKLLTRLPLRVMYTRITGAVGRPS